jgi:hypothetical protein
VGVAGQQRRRSPDSSSQFLHQQVKLTGARFEATPLPPFTPLTSIRCSE